VFPIFVFPIKEENLMEASTIPVLLQRLEKLERSNRRLKLSGLVVLLGLVAFGLMGQTRPPLQVVEAQEFVVKDAGGVVRARLGASPSAVSLNLSHEGGRASLVVSGGRGQGAHLAVSDSAGKIKGLLLLSPETVGLYLSSIDATGPPRSPRVVFEVLNQGTGGFAFYDKNGVTRALVGAVSDDGSSLMEVRDASGKPAWKAP
jgi:hypothetical protein